MNGTDADALSASYAQGRRDERKEAESRVPALVVAIFDALTCVDCHNCTKHYEQMRSARDAALAKEAK